VQRRVACSACLGGRARVVPSRRARRAVVPEQLRLGQPTATPPSRGPNDDHAAEYAHCERGFSASRRTAALDWPLRLDGVANTPQLYVAYRARVASGAHVILPFPSASPPPCALPLYFILTRVPRRCATPKARCTRPLSHGSSRRGAEGSCFFHLPLRLCERRGAPHLRTPAFRDQSAVISRVYVPYSYPLPSSS
jgi:hypothetical protein